ncbi:hypothetical protein JRQ81_008781 [Phrynocephalus forsythii]|uniref:Mediator of RNA polymerase II transcription subunit 26 n=1 Tax=Phrynocephalus forsythii TaxID=171643 RepID=A0A9Q1AT00_9SAUR|nr:hypothetical protein JRQ81_008781 [Phrynocephalus forsythii]
MTAAPGPSPQQIRDRLLQAIDPHSNIHNMVAVLEVISSLEKYPITKEALEETRLGKLINDVRKKTKNEELAKRAKKLLRNWQKLIEPVAPNEGALRGLPNAPGSANGGAHHCCAETPPGATAKPAPEAKNRHDVQKLRSPKPANRKRKGEGRESRPGPLCHCRRLPEGVARGCQTHPRLPPMASEAARRVSPALRTGAVTPRRRKAAGPNLAKQQQQQQQQQQEKADEPTAGQPRSPRCSSFSPRPVGLEAFARQHVPYSPKGGAPARSPRPSLLEAPATGSVSPPSPSSPPGNCRRPSGRKGSPGEPSPLVPAAGATGAEGFAPTEPSALAGAGFSPEPSRMDSDGAASGSDGKKKKKSRPKDYVVNLDGQVLEGGGGGGGGGGGSGVKPVRLKKERRLTFDPMTGEIKPLAHRDSLPVDLPALAEPPRTGTGKAAAVAEAKPPLHNPFEQANWKELSRNEIIQSYLSRQSSLLSSSGAQTPGAHYFMSEYLKQEESSRREARKTHVLAAYAKPSDLPGVTREVTPEDLERVGGRPWPGVNGCYDTQGNWYDWTQGISLDPHGDNGHLNILPYVSLD